MTSLARLASDTGGRFTERTNDLTVGYQRASQDLSCVYTVGFYVDESEEDRVRNVVIKAKREGLRAIHPSKYIFRSAGNRRESMLRAAWTAPDMFETGVVRAHLFPLAPMTRETWDAWLAISFPVSLAETDGANVVREFGAVLHDGPRVAHRFTRRLTLQPDHADVESTPVVTFLERVTLGDGEYTLTAVMSDPGDSDAHATRIEIVVPEIPKNELFLVGPVLGRPSGPNLVVTGGGGSQDSVGDENSFEPLLVHQLDEPVDLVAFSQACLVSKKHRAPRDARVARLLYDKDGTEIGSLEDQALEMEGYKRVRCKQLVDVIPATSLPDGEYVFEARLATKRGDSEPQHVRFAIDVPGP